MRRSFSKLSSLLSKRSDNDELRATLKFLAGGTRPAESISSLLRGASSGNKTPFVASTKEEDSKHVERILKILNSTLPEVESKKKRVEIHYDVLFTQLKNIVEKSIKESLGPQEKLSLAQSSEVLYDRLIMLQYTNQLRGVKEMAKIILAKNFKDFDKVWENISLFNEKQRLDLSILLYYRSGRKEIRQEYLNKWFENYHDLHITIQRVLWRCLIKGKDSIGHKSDHIKDYIGRITNWTSSDSVVLYQSLYAVAHFLPKELPNVNIKATKNQELFMASLRVLSRYGSELNGLTKWLIKIVKLSVENKIALEKGQSPALSSSASEISIYQYRFIRGLDLELQEIYSSCEGKQNCIQLQRDVEVILRNANDEEQEVKSQMSLKFI